MKALVEEDVGTIGRRCYSHVDGLIHEAPLQSLPDLLRGAAGKPRRCPSRFVQPVACENRYSEGWNGLHHMALVLGTRAQRGQQKADVVPGRSHPAEVAREVTARGPEPSCRIGAVPPDERGLAQRCDGPERRAGSLPAVLRPALLDDPAREFDCERGPAHDACQGGRVDGAPVVATELEAPRVALERAKQASGGPLRLVLPQRDPLALIEAAHQGEQLGVRDARFAAAGLEGSDGLFEHPQQGGAPGADLGPLDVLRIGMRRGFPADVPCPQVLSPVDQVPDCGQVRGAHPPSAPVRGIRRRRVRAPVRVLSPWSHLESAVLSTRLSW